MNFEYNLQESVSEECYNDIMARVNDCLIKMEIKEEHFADFYERMLKKHGPTLLKAVGNDVKNTAKGIKSAAGEFLSTSNSKVASVARKIPGVRAFARSHAAAQLKQGRAQANKVHQQNISNAIAKHQQNQYLANTSANPAQATARNNARLHASVNMSAQNKANKMQALQNKYSVTNN